MFLKLWFVAVQNKEKILIATGSPRRHREHREEQVRATVGTQPLCSNKHINQEPFPRRDRNFLSGGIFPPDKKCILLCVLCGLRVSSESYERVVEYNYVRQ